MATVLEELLIKVGVDVEQNELKKFNDVSVKVAATLNKVAIAGAAAASAIAVYSVKMGRATDTSIKFARSSGIALQSIQELEFAAQKEGAGAGELTSTLKGLNVQLGQMGIGSGPLQAIRRLRIPIRDANDELIKADDLLIRIGEAIQGLSPQRQAEIVGQFGISQNVLQLLQQGRFSIEELRKEARDLGFETDKFAKRNEQLNDRLLRLRIAVARALIPMREMFISMGEKWLPRIERWIENNKQLIPQLAKLATILAALFVASKVVAWTTAVVGATKALFGLAGAFKAVGVAKGIASAAGITGGAAGGLAGGTGAGALLGVGGTAAAGAGVGAALLPIAGAVAGIGAAFFGIKAILGYMERTAVTGQSAQEIYGNRIFNNQQSISFEINGATDPKEVGREVGKVLDSRNRNSVKTLQSATF